MNDDQKIWNQDFQRPSFIETTASRHLRHSSVRGPKLGLMQPHAGRCILAETARILRPIGPLSPIEMGRMEVAIADRSMSDTCLVVLNGVDEDGPNDGILGEGRKRECRLS